MTTSVIRWQVFELSALQAYTTRQTHTPLVSNPHSGSATVPTRDSAAPEHPEPQDPVCAELGDLWEGAQTALET